MVSHILSEEVRMLEVMSFGCKGRSLSTNAKVFVLEDKVPPRDLYDSESWELNAKEVRGVQVFHMMCWRKTL